MVNNPTLDELEKLRKDLNKSLSFQLSKLDDVIKDAENTHVLKEKKMRINKKEAIAFLMANGIVMVKFDNKKDAENLFE